MKYISYNTEFYWDVDIGKISRNFEAKITKISTIFIQDSNFSAGDVAWNTS